MKTKGSSASSSRSTSSCSARSTTDSNTPTCSESSSTKPWTLSHPQTEILWVRWTATTPAKAQAMARRLKDSLRAAKIRCPHPTYVGWYVGWNVHVSNATVLVLFHVEPEADLPKP